MRRLRCVCFAIGCVAALYLTSACHAQSGNKISSLDGVVFPAGLTMLHLVSICYCRHLFCDMWMCCVRRLRCVCFAILRVAALYLTSACHAQNNIKMSSLVGVVFPAGLTELSLVSFCFCRLLFRGAWM